MTPALADARQRQGQSNERQQPESDVDATDPAPAPVAREEAADQRPGDAGDPEDGAEEAQVAAALTRRDDVADGGLGSNQQAPAAEPLNRSKDDELGHPLRLAAEARADQEDDQRPLQDHLAAVQVAQLPVERGDDGDREQVGGDDPGE